MVGVGVDGDSEVGTVEPVARPIGDWSWFGIGVAAAVVGLLPWIITGMRLPLQNLWAADTLPAEMPFVLLPFSQYSVTLIAAIMVVGAAIAGGVARVTRSRQGSRGFRALSAGVLGAQAVAMLQTAAVVADGLRPGSDSTFYLVAVIAVAAASIVVGALVLVLIARMPRAGALIGLSLAVVAVGWWLNALVVPSPGLVTEVQTTLLGLLQWLPAILCGIAIAWCGINTVGRGVAALTAMAALVIGPAFGTAVAMSAGSRVLLPYPLEMLDVGRQVFVQALTTPALTLRPIVTTLIVAIAGLVLAAVLRRRQSPSAA